MLKVFDKVKKLDLSQWIVTKFYFYTSSVRDRIASYENYGFGKPRGDKYVKELFMHYLQVCNAYHQIDLGMDKFYSSGLDDNKITIEITNISNGDKLYIGQYDGCYHLGKSVWSEFDKYITFGKK